MFLFFTKHGNKETKKINEILEIQARGYLCINEREDLIFAVVALIFPCTDSMPLGAELYELCTFTGFLKSTLQESYLSGIIGQE